METSLIFVIVIMFYLCIIFPLQMRHYIKKRQQRLQSRSPQTTLTNTRSVTYVNNNRNRNDLPQTGQSDEQLVFGALHMPPPGTTDARREDEIAAARHLEAEHRQQIIDIQREIEQEAIRRREEQLSYPHGPHMPPRLINSSIIRDEAEYRQQIIDLQSAIEQQAIQHRNAPHIPPRLINSSTIRSSIYTITSDSVIGVTNSNVNYPHGPPATPSDDRPRQIHFVNRSISKDDELPSYDQAVQYDSTTTSVTIRRY